MNNHNKYSYCIPQNCYWPITIKLWNLYALWQKIFVNWNTNVLKKPFLYAMKERTYKLHLYMKMLLEVWIKWMYRLKTARGLNKRTTHQNVQVVDNYATENIREASGGGRQLKLHYPFLTHSTLKRMCR